jgi:Mrp family chromosome partitioning ATPase
MKPVLEYVRQLNQQSVSLRSEWLDRLRHVECDPGQFSLRPEIELSGASGLRGSDSRIHEAPVTVVSRTLARVEGSDRRDRPESSEQGLSEASGKPGLMNRLREMLGSELHVFAGSFRSPDPAADVPPPGSATSVATPVVAEPPRMADSVTHPPLPAPHERLLQINRDAVFSNLAPAIENLVPPGMDDESAATPEVVLDETADNCNESVDSRETGAETTDGTNAGPAEEPIRIQCQVRDSEIRRMDYRRCTHPRSIDKITEQLIARFPTVSSSTIMFASLTPGLDVDGIAAKVATCLAIRDLGGILLIDGNAGSRELSTIMGTGKSPGLTDVVNTARSLSATICGTDNPNLEFLPFGTNDLTWRRLDARRAAALSREFNQGFQYAIISGGSVNGPLVQFWSGFVDAIYLLIDIDTADRFATTEIVNQLHGQAARIAGIIAVGD